MIEAVSASLRILEEDVSKRPSKADFRSVERDVASVTEALLRTCENSAFL